MTWAEAFKKAIAATGWMVVFGIIFGVIFGVGITLGAFGALSGEDGSVGSVIAGWILIIIAYVGLIFGAMAISFKYISESVTETLMKRLYPPSAPAQPQSPQQMPPAK